LGLSITGQALVLKGWSTAAAASSQTPRDEAPARALDKAASATGSDYARSQHLDSHGFLLLTSIIYR
jgi:hypothetical protein